VRPFIFKGGASVRPFFPNWTQVCIPFPVCHMGVVCVVWMGENSVSWFLMGVLQRCVGSCESCTLLRSYGDMVVC
jgi:hypothetical protein